MTRILFCTDKYVASSAIINSACTVSYSYYISNYKLQEQQLVCNMHLYVFTIGYNALYNFLKLNNYSYVRSYTNTKCMKFLVNVSHGEVGSCGKHLLTSQIGGTRFCPATALWRLQLATSLACMERVFTDRCRYPHRPLMWVACIY